MDCRLQKLLNAAAANKVELFVRKYPPSIFRVGDAVMQTSNNYAKNVMNGDQARRWLHGPRGIMATAAAISGTNPKL